MPGTVTTGSKEEGRTAEDITHTEQRYMCTELCCVKMSLQRPPFSPPSSHVTFWQAEVEQLQVKSGSNNWKASVILTSQYGGSVDQQTTIDWSVSRCSRITFENRVQTIGRQV